MIMLVALYLLYRIAFPKQTKPVEGNVTAPDAPEVVVKSRFVRPLCSQPQPTHTTPLESEFQEEKPSIFAAGNEKRPAVIPTDELDKFFEDEPNPEDLDIDDDDDDEIDIDIEDEETERFGHEAMLY